ncbi:MAG: hypothetical protein Q8898_12895 [Bacillota bacterium]|nr:hypothetical protein [Bacillota bacterium]
MPELYPVILLLLVLKALPVPLTEVAIMVLLYAAIVYDTGYIGYP